MQTQTLETPTAPSGQLIQSRQFFSNRAQEETGYDLEGLTRQKAFADCARVLCDLMRDGRAYNVGYHCESEWNKDIDQTAILCACMAWLSDYKQAEIGEFTNDRRLDKVLFSIYNATGAENFEQRQHPYFGFGWQRVK